MTTAVRTLPETSVPSLPAPRDWDWVDEVTARLELPPDVAPGGDVLAEAACAVTSCALGQPDELAPVTVDGGTTAGCARALEVRVLRATPTLVLVLADALDATGRRVGTGRVTLSRTAR